MEEEIGGCWIPPQIYHRDDITNAQKVFLGRVHSLSKKTGWCYASNNYLADDTGVSVSTIKRWIPDLIDKGVLLRVTPQKDRKLSLNLPLKNPCPDDTPQNDTPHPPQNDTPQLSTREKGKSTTNYSQEQKEIFEHWVNQNQTISHRKKTSRMDSAIKARLEDGFEVDEIKQAISNYNEVLESEDYFFNYDAWSLNEFLSRGEGEYLEKFLHKMEAYQSDNGQTVSLPPLEQLDEQNEGYWQLVLPEPFASEQYPSMEYESTVRELMEDKDLRQEEAIEYLEDKLSDS